MAFQIVKKSRARAVGVIVAIFITGTLVLGFLQSYQKAKLRQVKKIDLVEVIVVAEKTAPAPILYEAVLDESCIKQLTFDVIEKLSSSSMAVSQAASTSSSISSSRAQKEKPIKPEPPLVAARSPSCIAPTSVPVGFEKLGGEGYITLELNLAKTGRVERGEIEKSSGFIDLDTAALTQVKDTWKFQPCTKENVIVACKHRIRFRWQVK
jgi:TonB family protein